MKSDLLRLTSERLIPSDSLPVLSKLEDLKNINCSDEIEEARFPKVGLVGRSTWFGLDAGVTHRVGHSWITPELSQGGLLRTPVSLSLCPKTAKPNPNESREEKRREAKRREGKGSEANICLTH